MNQAQDGTKTYGIEEIKDVFLEICHVCEKQKDSLTEIDSKLGDGDMGISMNSGAKAIRNTLSAFPKQEKNLTKLFLASAMACNRAAPSTLGTLLSFGMMAVGKELNNAIYVEETAIPSLVKRFADTISEKGKAKTGDKTILDALYPYAETLESVYGRTGSLDKALIAAGEAAKAGMESTKGKKAKTGRASWLDTRNMEYPDAGAVLCVLVVEALEKYRNGQKDK